MSGWASLRALLEPALQHSGNTHDIGDVEALLADGDAQAWLGERSVLVTTIEEHPRCKTLTLWLGGGDLTELKTLLRPRAEAWGLAEGCGRAVILGRGGWVRALSDVGYHEAARLAVKELAP